ncbi:MAG: hypothetical protein V1787_04680 [Candidatus Micrarchaeota archaeon]
MKRGQSALEYLVTYGWAILAIVIIAAVLWYTGVFNPSKIAGGGKSGGGFGVFTYSDHTVTTADPFATVKVGNAVGRQINVTAAKVNGVDCNGNLPTTIAPNGLVTVTCSSDVSNGLTAGAAYDFGVTISYIDSQSLLAHTDTGGFIRGKVE